MFFSDLFALLVLIGIIPIFAGSLIDGAFYIFIAYNALLLALLVLDYIITPSPKALEVERVCEEKFSLGTDNEVGISVRNNSRYLLSVELKDEVPLYFKVINSFVGVKAIPHVTSEGKYFVIPQKRGQFEFGIIHFKYKGVLKLCTKYGKAHVKRLYKVYPNLKDLRKLSFSALKKIQMMDGQKKAKGYGIGTEFESLKEYNVGDDLRKINWIATARANKFIVNAYEPEKNQQVFIMLDSSRVMNSEINYIKKLDYAINSSFLLAEIAIKKGDNIGLVVFDSDVKRFIKPGKGMNHFQLIAENLYNVEENFVTANYEGALVYLSQYHKRRSLLCIFTELFNVDEAIYLMTALKGVARNHVPLVITINDTRIYDMVNSDIREENDIFQKSAAIKAVEERERIKKVFADAGIACIDVPPDKLSMEVVNRYLTMKAMLRI